MSGISTIRSFSHPLGVWKVFSDDKVGLLYHIFGVISKKSLPNPRSQNICIFQEVVCYYTEIYDPLWVNFNIMQNKKLYLYLMYIFNCVKTICWKITFSALNFLCTFLRNELLFYVWMYLEFYSVSFIYMLSLLLILGYLENYEFIVSFNFFQIVELV